MVLYSMTSRIHFINGRFILITFSASVSEMAKVGDRVVHMSATDGDTENSGGITYKLVDGNELGNEFHNHKLKPFGKNHKSHAILVPRK